MGHSGDLFNLTMIANILKGLRGLLESFHFDAKRFLLIYILYYS